MKKIDGEKFPIQTIRPPKLCCLVDPEFICKLCKTRICTGCNDKDVDLAEEFCIDVEDVGHSSAECLDRPASPNSSNWIVV